MSRLHTPQSPRLPPDLVFARLTSPYTASKHEWSAESGPRMSVRAGGKAESALTSGRDARRRCPQTGTTCGFSPASRRESSSRQIGHVSSSSLASETAAGMSAVADVVRVCAARLGEGGGVARSGCCSDRWRVEVERSELERACDDEDEGERAERRGGWWAGACARSGGGSTNGGGALWPSDDPVAAKEKPADVDDEDEGRGDDAEEPCEFDGVRGHDVGGLAGARCEWNSANPIESAVCAGGRRQTEMSARRGLERAEREL